MPLYIVAIEADDPQALDQLRLSYSHGQFEEAMCLYEFQSEAEAIATAYSDIAVVGADNVQSCTVYEVVKKVKVPLEE